MLLGVLMLLLGLALLGAHRPLARFLHESEGRRRESFGGLTRARVVILLVGAAFTLTGGLTVIGVFDG